MATNATVTRTRTVHPTLVVGAAGALCVAIGLIVGIAVGASFPRTAAPPAATTVTSKISSDVSASGRATTELQLRSNGVIPAAAPGNPYVNIHMPVRAATGVGITVGALNDLALQEHGRGERAGN